jgi:hypothetical protein
LSPAACPTWRGGGVRQGGRGGGASSGVVICFVFTPVFGIVLGDNKNKQTAHLNNQYKINKIRIIFKKINFKK